MVAWQTLIAHYSGTGNLSRATVAVVTLSTAPVECLEADRRNHSTAECQMFRSLSENSTGFSDYALDYLRLLVRVILRKLDECLPLGSKRDDGLKFEHVWNLCSNMSGFDETRMKEFRAVAVELKRFMDMNAAATGIIPDFLNSQEQLLELICKEECNSFGLYKFRDSLGGSRKSYGLALFPLAVYFNHSCCPNVVHASLNCEELFFANRNIKAGEELLITYIPLRQPFQSRMEELKQVFMFDCDCKRCASKDGSEKTSPLSFLCKQTTCQGTYLPHGSDGKMLALTYQPEAVWKCEACNGIR